MKTAGPSTALRSGRDDKIEDGAFASAVVISEKRNTTLVNRSVAQWRDLQFARSLIVSLAPALHLLESPSELRSRRMRTDESSKPTDATMDAANICYFRSRSDRRWHCRGENKA